MISYMIKGGLLTYSFLSNLFVTMPGPNQDPFEILHSPVSLNNIDSFVASHHQFALSSRQPSFSLQSRFLVTIIGLNKAGMPVQHESFAVWVLDKVTLKRHEFIIERVPSDRSYTSRFSMFSQFPASQNVLDSIQKAIHNMRSMTAQAAESLWTTVKTETETESLLPLTNCPSSESSSSISQTNTPQMSLIDKVTSSLVRAVAVARSGSQSISPQSLARDTISGCPPETLILEDCIRKFEPVGLSLFDVVLLAHVVHEYAPIYGLFDNHCYMFASVMFDAIVQLYSLRASAFNPALASTSTSDTSIPAPTREVGAPKNANIVVLPSPDQAGRWSGLLILDPIVKATIVSIVISQFRVERGLYMATV
jgi:hypothetical protein